MKTPLWAKKDEEFLRLFRIVDKLMITEGAVIYKDLMHLRTAIFIYKENYRILKKTLKSYHSDIRNLNSNSVKRWRQQRVLIKDFHNVLTSVRTYIEQHDYQESYLKDPFHCFMKELRNFIIHKQTLRLVSKATAEKRKFIRYESMDWKAFENYLDEQINEHKKRNGLKYAKDYLLSLSGKVSLDKVLEDYDRKVSLFHKGFLLDKVRANSGQLEEFAKEVTNIHQKEREIGMTTDYPITKPQLRHLLFLIIKSKSDSN